MKMMCIVLTGLLAFSIHIASVFADAGGYQPVESSSSERAKADDHYKKGLDYQKQGKFAEAIQEYRSALDIVPDWAEAYNNLGYSYRMSGNFDKAILAYKEALRLKPNLAEAHEYLAKAYLAKGMKKEAEQEYQVLLQLNPKMAAEVRPLLHK